MRLGVVTDVHLAPPGTPNVRCHGLMRLDEAEGRLERALAFLLERDVNAIAVLGDHSHFGDHESLTKALALLAGAALPVYVVCGNHDLSRPLALEQALSELGARSVEIIGETGFLVTTGVRIAGVPLAGRDSGRSAAVVASPPVDKWDRDAVLLLSHYPVLSLESQTVAAGFEHQWDAENLDLLAIPLLARAAPTIVLCGHQHVRDVSFTSSILQLAGASLVEPPGEVALVELELEAGLIVRRTVIPVASPTDERAPDFAAPVVTYGYKHSPPCWQEASAAISGA